MDEMIELLIVVSPLVVGVFIIGIGLMIGNRNKKPKQMTPKEQEEFDQLVSEVNSNGLDNL